MAEGFGLGDILKNVNDYFNDLEGAKETVERVQAVQKQLGEDQARNVQAAGLPDGQGGRQTAITVQAEELAALNAQNQARKAATAMGTNMDDSTEILTSVAAEVKNSALNMITKAQVVDEKASTKLLDNPIKYVWDQITLDGAVEEATAAKERFSSTNAALTQLQTQTQNLPKTTAAIAEVRTAATVQSKLEATEAAISAAANKVRIDNADRDIAGIQQLNQLTAQQIQALGTAYSAKNQEEHMKLARQSAALQQKEASRREAEWTEKLETKKANETEQKEWAGYISKGLAMMGYKDLAQAPASKLIQLFNSKEQIFRDAFKTGILNQTTKNPTLSDNPAEVARILVQHKVPLDPAQATVKELYQGAIAEVRDPKQATKHGIADVNKADQVLPAVGRLVVEKAKTQHRVIDPRDQSNIYAAPSLQSMMEIPAVANTKLMGTVLKEQIAAGGLKELNPEQLIAFAADAIKKGEDYKTISKDLHTVFTAVPLVNNKTKNYKGLGLPEQTGFNTTLPNSMGIKTIRNLANPVDVDTALNIKMQSMSAGFSSNLMKFNLPNVAAEFLTERALSKTERK